MTDSSGNSRTGRMTTQKPLTMADGLTVPADALHAIIRKGCKDHVKNILIKEFVPDLGAHS
jgi:hypothetical protein